MRRRGDELARGQIGRRHAAGRHQRLAVEIENGHSRKPDALHVGGDLGTEHGGLEAGAVGPHDEHVLEIFGLGLAVLHLAYIAAGKLDLGQEKPHGIAVGDIAQILPLLGEPGLHGVLAAVGDEAEPVLPGAQIALPQVVDEAEDLPDPKGGNKQDPRRGENDAGTDAPTLSFRLGIQ